MDKIKINGKEYIVEKFTKEKELKKGYAYIIKSGEVYIYRGKIKDESKNPGIYKEGNKYKIIKYKKGKEIYFENSSDKEDNILNKIKRDKEQILKTKVKLTDAERSDLYKPGKKEEDEILVQIVKFILEKEEKSFKELAHKFKDMQEANNSKGGLLKHSKMSISRFLRWMEVLDYEVTFELKSKETGKVTRFNENRIY